MKFGKWKDSTVQEMLNHNRNLQLISAYYKLTSINYTDDILQELGITGKWVIEKPSSDKELYTEFLNANGYEKIRNKALEKLNKPTKHGGKSYLQRINQGH